MLKHMRLHALTYAYLQQVAIYHSDSKGEWVDVAKMHPAHAKNAAAKMLDEAEAWAEDAMVYPANATLWMSAQPLFRALVDRAGF